MLLSLNWLKQYVDLPKKISPKELGEALTLSTVEVESVHDLSAAFEKIVIGEIKEIKNHPNADKLRIVMTDIGQGDLVQIVCGGTNLHKNMLVAVALPGAKVRWHGEGEPVVLEKTKIRGEESLGMICSANEIGLEKSFLCGPMEIVDLSGIKKASPGQNLGKVIGADDVVLEIDNKSLTNRPDLWSHYGIARELAAIYNLKTIQPDFFDGSKLSSSGHNFKITIEDHELCRRYFGCWVKNIKVAASPEWLVNRLAAVGLRSINNIVDITNYVMLDLGEPMHAFDKSKIDQIIVRRASKNERITTLDGIERKLNETMLVIADKKRPIALAGVMGGLDSSVDTNTNEIILEAANFKATNIRKTSQALSLRTESSNRFEKALDPKLAEQAILRALALINVIMPEAEVVCLTDVNYSDQSETVVKISHDFITERIGQNLTLSEIESILMRLGFKVKIKKAADKKEFFEIKVPSWRATGDISIPEDIVEEIARIYGYGNLNFKPASVSLTSMIYQPEHDFETKVKNYLSGPAAMHEVFNYPWIDQRILSGLGWLNHNLLRIANPPAEENKFLKDCLLPGLVRNIEDNLRYFEEFKIFEMARAFSSEIDKETGLPKQQRYLSGAFVSKQEDTFLAVKGIMEGLFVLINNKELNLVEPQKNEIWPKGATSINNLLLPEKSLSIVWKKEKIGWLAEASPLMHNNFDFKNKKVTFFEINFDSLVTAYSNNQIKKYQPLPLFPRVERDLAFEFDYKVKWGEVRDAIQNSIKDSVINQIIFLSEYDLNTLTSSKHENKKSLAFRINYQASDRTLTDKEVEAIEKEIINLIERNFGGQLRQ